MLSVPDGSFEEARLDEELRVRDWDRRLLLLLLRTRLLLRSFRRSLLLSSSPSINLYSVVAADSSTAARDRDLDRALLRLRWLRADEDFSASRSPLLLSLLLVLAVSLRVMARAIKNMKATETTIMTTPMTFHSSVSEEYPEPLLPPPEPSSDEKNLLLWALLL